MSYWWLRIAKAFQDKSVKLGMDGDMLGAAMMQRIAEVFKELAE